MSVANKKIVIGITAPLSIVLLDGQLKYFSDAGYQVFLMAPKMDVVTKFCEKENSTHIPVDIVREISFFNDLKALFQIIRHLKQIKPDIINVGTPKMGLLGTIGAFITRVKKRFYTCRGFRYEHEAGLKKKTLVLMEKLTARLAQKVICISPSVKEMGIKDQIFPENKTIIFGKGSSNGVNLDRFNKDKIDQQLKANLIRKLGVANKFIFGFVGRIVDRKGLNELFQAFGRLYQQYPNLHLIIVGKANLEQVSDKSLIEKMKQHPGVTLTGYQENVPLYMSLFDVFVLPAWWEGFGNTLIQAAAMSVPVISTNVTGCKDAVSNGYNGILVNKNSIEELIAAMESLFINKSERERLGKNGLIWSKNFDSQKIWQELNALYES